MTRLKTFPPKSSVQEALKIVCENADDLVVGGISGMMVMVSLTPLAGIHLATVIGVLVNDDLAMDGYMISILPTVEDAKLPYEDVCEKAIAQQFIGVDDNGHATTFIPAGKTAERFQRLAMMN